MHDACLTALKQNHISLCHGKAAYHIINKTAVNCTFFPAIHNNYLWVHLRYLDWFHCEVQKLSPNNLMNIPAFIHGNSCLAVLFTGNEKKRYNPTQNDTILRQYEPWWDTKFAEDHTHFSHKGIYGHQMRQWIPVLYKYPTVLNLCLAKSISGNMKIFCFVFSHFSTRG